MTVHVPSIESLSQEPNSTFVHGYLCLEKYVEMRGNYIRFMLSVYYIL